MSVLIGLIDQEVLKNDSFGWETSKIGGLPRWVCSEITKTECTLCGQVLTLVAQIYCPLNGSLYHRCLYVFMCSQRDCNRQLNGWRVFRSQLIDNTYRLEAERKKTQPDLFKDSWTDDQDDWGDEPGDSIEEDALSCPSSETDTRITSSESGCQLEPDRLEVQHICGEDTSDAALSQLTIHDNKDQTQTEAAGAGASGDASGSSVLMEEFQLPDSQRLTAIAGLLNTQDKTVSEKSLPVMRQWAPAVFKSYYLCVVEEPSNVSAVDVHVVDLIKKYEKEEGKNLDELLNQRSGKLKHSGENYEKTELKHGDKIFHKFLKRLQRCPEQVIRYDRGGEPPLMICEMDIIQRVPTCPYCGSERIFELQLLPSLIPWLTTENGSEIEVDFGTVLVYTCQSNCWPQASDPSCGPSLLEESIVLQADPDHKFFR